MVTKATFGTIKLSLCPTSSTGKHPPETCSIFIASAFILDIRYVDIFKNEHACCLSRYFLQFEASRGYFSKADVAIDDFSLSPECFGIGNFKFLEINDRSCTQGGKKSLFMAIIKMNSISSI